MVNFINSESKEPLFCTPKGLVDHQNHLFPRINGIYRICEQKGSYTANFGFQWKKFKQTQIDKFNNTNFSKERFFAVTHWDKESLEKKNILEAGCGAGRFTQTVLDYTKANLYSFDSSEAVEANFENNGYHPRLKLFQCSIYEMPFAENSFDKVFCFGVLQHTPNPQKSIECLSHVLKPGGELIVDFYPYNGFWTKLNAKYLLRPFIKKLPNEQLLSLIRLNIEWMLFLSKFFIRVKFDKIFNRFIPICDVQNILSVNLSKKNLKEWAILDTFDMFSPEYDFPQKTNTVKKWMEETGLTVTFAGLIKYGKNNSATVVKSIKK